MITGVVVGDLEAEEFRMAAANISGLARTRTFCPQLCQSADSAGTFIEGSICAPSSPSFSEPS